MRKDGHVPYPRSSASPSVGVAVLPHPAAPAGGAGGGEGHATLLDHLAEIDLAAQHAVADRQGPSTPHSPTSWMAAHANRVRSGGQRRRILEALHTRGDHGATDYELGVACGLLRTAAGTRRKELEELELVEQTQRTRLTDTGSPAYVHVLTDLGRQVKERLDESR